LVANAGIIIILLKHQFEIIRNFLFIADCVMRDIFL